MICTKQCLGMMDVVIKGKLFPFCCFDDVRLQLTDGLKLQMDKCIDVSEDT